MYLVWLGGDGKLGYCFIGHSFFLGYPYDHFLILGGVLMIDWHSIISTQYSFVMIDLVGFI